MALRSGLVFTLIAAAAVYQQATASCLRKRKLGGCGKTSLSSATDYSDYSESSFNDLTSYNGQRWPVEVVHYGEPCHRMKAMSYSVEVPKKRPEPARGFEYGYSVETMPQPHEGPRGFTFDYQVEVPKSRPQVSLNSYNYHMEVPARAPEPPRGFAFDYQVEVPKPKSPVKTYEYSYQVNHPAPKRHEIVGQSFDYQLEVPRKPAPERRLEGLVAQVDKVLLPRNYGCPPDVEDNAIAESSESYGAVGGSGSFAGGFGYLQNELSLSGGSQGYSSSDEESTNVLDVGYSFGGASYESLQSRPHKARYANNHTVARRSCARYPYGYSITAPTFTDYRLPQPSDHLPLFRHRLPSLPTSELYPPYFPMYDYSPYYLPSSRLDKRESIATDEMLSQAAIDMDNIAYGTPDTLEYRFRDHSPNSVSNDLRGNDLTNQRHLYVPNGWNQVTPYLYHPNIYSRIADSTSKYQENNLYMDTLAEHNSSANTSDQQHISEGQRMYNADDVFSMHAQGMADVTPRSNPTSDKNYNQTNDGATAAVREKKQTSGTTEFHVKNSTSQSGSQQNPEEAMELTGIPILGYYQPTKYVILSEDGSPYDFDTSAEVDDSAANEERGNSIETTISQHYLKSHTNGYFIPNIGMGNHWKFSKPAIRNEKQFLPSWLQEPKPDIASDSGFRILKEKVFPSSNGIRRFYEEEPLHRIRDVSMEEEHDEVAYDSDENPDSSWEFGYSYDSVLEGKRNYESQEFLSPSYNGPWNHNRPVRKALKFPKPTRKVNRKIGKVNCYKNIQSSPRLSERLRKRKFNLLRKTTADKLKFLNKPNYITCYDASKLVGDSFGISIPQRVTHPIVGLNSPWYCRGLYPYRGNGVHRLDCGTKPADEHLNTNCQHGSEDHVITETVNREENLDQKTEQVEVTVSELSGAKHPVQLQHTEQLSVMEANLAGKQEALEVDIVNNGRVGIDLKATIMHPHQSDSDNKQELFQFEMTEKLPMETAETSPHVKKTLEENCLDEHRVQYNHDVNKQCDCGETHSRQCSHSQHQYSNVENVHKDATNNNLVEIKLQTDIGKPPAHHIANYYYPIYTHHVNGNNADQHLHKIDLSSNIAHPYFHQSMFPYYILPRPPHTLHHGSAGNKIVEIETENKEIIPQKDIVEVHVSSHEVGNVHFEAQDGFASETITDKIGEVVADHIGNTCSSAPASHFHTGEHHTVISETQQETHDSVPITSSYSLSLHHQHSSVLPAGEEQVKINVVKDKSQEIHTDDCKNQQTELTIVQSPTTETELISIDVNSENSSPHSQHQVSSLCEEDLVKDHRPEDAVINVIQHADLEDADHKIHSVSIYQEKEPMPHFHIIENGDNDFINSNNRIYETTAYNVIPNSDQTTDSQGNIVEIHIVNKSDEQTEIAAGIIADVNSQANIKSESQLECDEQGNNAAAAITHDKRRIQFSHQSHPHISVAQNKHGQILNKYYPNFEIGHYGPHPSKHTTDHVNKFVGSTKFNPIYNKNYLQHFVPHAAKYGKEGNSLSYKAYLDLLKRRYQANALNKGLVIPYGALHGSYYHSEHPLVLDHKEHRDKIKLEKINAIDVDHATSNALHEGSKAEQESLIKVSLEHKQGQNADIHKAQDSQYSFGVLNKLHEGMNTASKIAHHKNKPHIFVLNENRGYPGIFQAQHKIAAHSLASHLSAGVQNLETASKERIETALSVQDAISALGESQGKTEYDTGKEQLEVDILKNTQGGVSIKTELNHPQHHHSSGAAYVHSNVLYEGTQPNAGVGHHHQYRPTNYNAHVLSKVGDHVPHFTFSDRDLHSDRMQSKIEEAMDKATVHHKFSHSHIPPHSYYYDQYRYVPQQGTIPNAEQDVSDIRSKQQEAMAVSDFRNAEMNMEDKAVHEDVGVAIPVQPKDIIAEHSPVASIVIDSIGSVVQNQPIGDIAEAVEKAVGHGTSFRSSEHFEAASNSETPLQELVAIESGGLSQGLIEAGAALEAGSSSSIHQHEGSVNVIQSKDVEKQEFTQAMHERQQHLEIMKQLQEQYQQKYGMHHELQTVEHKPLQQHQPFVQFPHHEVQVVPNIFDKNIHVEKEISQQQAIQHHSFQEATQEFSNLKDYFNVNKGHQQNLPTSVISNLKDHQELHNLQANKENIHFSQNTHQQHELLDAHKQLLVEDATQIQDKFHSEHGLEKIHHKATAIVQGSQALQNKHEQVSFYDTSKQIPSGLHESSKLYNLQGQQFYSQKHQEEMKTFKDESKSKIMSVGAVTHVKPWQHKIPLNPFVPQAPINLIGHPPSHIHQHHHQHVKVPAYGYRAVETQIPRPFTKREIRSI